MELNKLNQNVMSDSVRLNEFDKEEWFDVCRRLCPGLGEEEYARMWDEFHAEKEARQKQQRLH